MHDVMKSGNNQNFSKKTNDALCFICFWLLISSRPIRKITYQFLIVFNCKWYIIIYMKYLWIWSFHQIENSMSTSKILMHVEKYTKNCFAPNVDIKITSTKMKHLKCNYEFKQPRLLKCRWLRYQVSSLTVKGVYVFDGTYKALKI